MLFNKTQSPDNNTNSNSLLAISSEFDEWYNETVDNYVIYLFNKIATVENKFKVVTQVKSLNTNLFYGPSITIKIDGINVNLSTLYCNGAHIPNRISKKKWHYFKKDIISRLKDKVDKELFSDIKVNCKLNGAHREIYLDGWKIRFGINLIIPYKCAKNLHIYITEKSTSQFGKCI